MNSNRVYLLIILFSLLFIRWSDGVFNPESGIQQEVRIIHNEQPLWGDKPEVSLEFVQKFGKIESEDENYMLYRPTDVIRDNEGNIYILDTGNHRIQKYDSDGKYLLTIGQKGQGPNEITDPTGMNLSSKNEIYVCDLGNNRIQVFSTDGEGQRTLRTDINRRITHFRFLKTDELIARPAPYMLPNEDLKDISLLTVLNNDCLLERGIGTGRLEDFGDFVITVFMSMVVYDRDSEDNVYLAYSYQNKVEKFSPDGALLFRADRPIDVDVNMRPQKPNDVVLVSQSLAVDGKDRLWISTSMKHVEGLTQEDWVKETDEQHVALDILNSDGVYLGRLSLPEMGNTPAITPVSLPTMGNIRIYGDRLFIVDILNKMCVYEYKIVEN